MAEQFKDYIEKGRNSLARFIPPGSGLDIDSLIANSVAVVAMTPALAKCTFASIFAAVAECAKLGLTPGKVRGEAYLVPFKDQCEFVIGYRGELALARRHGGLKSVTVGARHTKDGWNYLEGTRTILEHRPYTEGDPGDLLAFYCVLKLNTGGVQVTVLRKAEVDAIRARSRASNNGPWVTDYEEMGKKSAIKRASKLAGLTEASDADDGEVIEGSLVGSSATAAVLAARSRMSPAPALAEDTTTIIEPEEEKEPVRVRPSPPAEKGQVRSSPSPRAEKNEDPWIQEGRGPVLQSIGPPQEGSSKSRRKMVVPEEPKTLGEKLEASVKMAEATRLEKAKRLADSSRAGDKSAKKELNEMMPPNLFSREGFLEAVGAAKTSEEIELLGCFTEAYEGIAAKALFSEVCSAREFIEHQESKS